MVKFAVLCGAVVLASASLNAQSTKDKSPATPERSHQEARSAAPRPTSPPASRPSTPPTTSPRAPWNQGPSSTPARPPERRSEPVRQTPSTGNRTGTPWGGTSSSSPSEPRQTRTPDHRRNEQTSTGNGAGWPWGSGSSSGDRQTRTPSHGSSSESPYPGGKDPSRGSDDRGWNRQPYGSNGSNGSNGWSPLGGTGIQTPDQGNDRNKDRNKDRRDDHTSDRDHNRDQKDGDTSGKAPWSQGGHTIKKDPPHLEDTHGVDGRKDPHPGPIRRPPARKPDIPDRWRHEHDWDHRSSYINYGHDYWRIGFVYCNDWYRNPQWHYTNYYYEPSTVVVTSPFYYYPELPPYLNVSSVTYGGSYPNDDPYSWTSYNYYYPGDSGFSRAWDDDPYGRTTQNDRSYTISEDRYGDRTKFDRAVDDIIDAFARGDERFVQNLIPVNGNVAITQDGAVRYAVAASDFENMYRDLIETTRSRGYRVLEVRVFADNSAWISAQHDRLDPYGNLTTVYHQYRLGYEGRRFVIRRFGVSYDRPL